MPKHGLREQLYKTSELRCGRSVQGPAPRLSERLSLRLARPPLITLNLLSSNWFVEGFKVGCRRRDVSQPASYCFASALDGDKAGIQSAVSFKRLVPVSFIYKKLAFETPSDENTCSVITIRGV